MANPLEQSIRSAIRANARIGDSFARLGTKSHPRGFVISAYRRAHKDIVKALADPYPTDAVVEVLGGLKTGLRADLREEFNRMYGFGVEEARRQMAYYGVQTYDNPALELTTKVDSAVDVCLAKVDAQAATVRALMLTGSTSQITGDENRVGVVRYSDVVVAGAYWTTALVWAGYAWRVEETTQAAQFSKQAVAALDNRTTDCCLQVHGQIQPFNQPFVLEGTPRYADEMDWPAFHNYCRTSGVLYLPGFDDNLTARMQDSARTILQERADGLFIDRDPADAFG
jgi:hypothetical protein